MNKDLPITFQAYALEEFRLHTMDLGGNTFEKGKFNKLNRLLNKLLEDNSAVFDRIEQLAQIPDSTELTIFFSDFLERMDYDDPNDIVGSIENISSDFITLMDLLFEEEDNLRAIEKFISDTEHTEEDTAEGKEAIETAAEEAEIASEAEAETEAARVEYMDDGSPEFTLHDFVFTHLRSLLNKKLGQEFSQDLMIALIKYTEYLGENFKRNAKLLLNQPSEEGQNIARVLIDYLIEAPEKLLADYWLFMENTVDRFKKYAENNGEDLLASYAAEVDAGMKAVASGDKADEKKVLQEKIFSYFEKEANSHLDEIETKIKEKDFEAFWTELEALKTLVMIHGYEAFETACLRIQREKEQRGTVALEEILSGGLDEVMNALRKTLELELEGKGKDTKKVLNELSAVLEKETSAEGKKKSEKEEEKERDEEYSVSDISSKLEAVWMARLKERALEELPYTLAIDYDNAVLLGYPEEFTESIRGILSYYEQSSFNPEDWKEFFNDWPRILSLKNTELLTQYSDKAIEYGKNAAISIEQQEIIVPEIFRQLSKRFDGYAPYFQLTDDEQAYFQSQISELGVFISNEAYMRYVEKLIEMLNEYFYEEASDKLVKKYFERISVPFEKLTFPLDDLDIDKYLSGKEKKAETAPQEKESGWIDEVESAVGAEASDEFVEIFKSEGADNIKAILEHLQEVEDGNYSAIAQIENNFHNISSSAGLIGLKNTSEISTQVEDILEHVYSGGNGEGELLPVAILRDIVSGINKVVENPDADKDVDPSVAMADFQNWYEQLKGVEAPVGGAEEIGIPAEEDEDFALDVELLEAFEAEAGKNINTIFEALSVLGKTPDSQEALKNLDSACHDITSAAKMLGFTAIGDLSFKIENFADKALQGEAEFDSDKALFLRESVEAIQGVMQQKRSEKSLLPLIDSFENKLNSAEETATFENYINSAFSEDISAFIFAGKEEAFIRRYVGNVAAVLTGGAVNTWVNSLIDSPLDEWMNILSAPPQPETGKEEPVSAPAAKPAKEIVGYENSDFLLDSSAALVDSQLEMQEQLKRNKEILKELNSTQNLLNYVKSELDEIAASGADSPQKKKRQAELNSILEKAVAKMNHLVSEMGRLNTAFESRISSLDNLSFTFQRNILKARQQKAGQLYKHLEEHIAELKKFTEKEFTVEFSGESVKLDKTTLDFLYEPLKELISNAVVHGIEGPGERKKAGKPESGLINVKLSKKRNLVHLTVRDDGKGIDTALIRKKAEEKGLKIDGDETALIDTLFSSGFTLLEEKGEFAGDGEGLYQLRKTFETMRGDISLESEQGAYTQITMIFPQHLKVTDAAIISNNEDYFAIPLGADDTTTTIKKSEIVFSNGDLWVNRNGKFHPLALLSGLLSEEESKLAGNKFDAVQFKLGELDLFLVVDRVIGMETIVIRPLQKEVKAISFLAGVAQLPDSRTLLVLETDILLKELENKINFEYTVKESTVSRSQSADVKNFEHAVVFSANDVTRNFIADILREMGIETEEITEIREWTEDMDKADLLLIEEDGFHAIKEMKGLWIDAPRKIIIIHEGKLKDLPIGADGILAKPFDKEDLLKLIE